MTSEKIAVIGGSGFYDFPGLLKVNKKTIESPYGAAGPITEGQLNDVAVVFLPRHGVDHTTPPHRINYRANLWALKGCDVTAILALNAVGGIHQKAAPGTLVIPDQIIDYTWGREHTFAESIGKTFGHIDFTYPYAAGLREQIIAAANALSVDYYGEGVYGCCQGPRLETAAEIEKLRRDGCDIVGMTAMPEAALARELNIPYASICPVVNWAAGIQKTEITLTEITARLEAFAAVLQTLLSHVVTSYSSSERKL